MASKSPPPSPPRGSRSAARGGFSKFHLLALVLLLVAALRTVQYEAARHSYHSSDTQETTTTASQQHSNKALSGGVGQQRVRVENSLLLATDTKQRNTQQRHRHDAGPKESFGNVTFDRASVLSKLYLPGTDSWRLARVSRFVVNQKLPDNKYSKAPISPALLPTTDLEERRFGTCAVVGNSGVLTLSRFGRAIDTNDAVIRFNDGPTTGFEKLVGSRTTFRILNNAWTSTWLRRPPHGQGSPLNGSLVLFGISSARAWPQLAKKFGADKVLFMAPEFAGAARGQYKKANAAVIEAGYMTINGRNSAPTGVEGLFFALALCERVRLYGYGVEHDPKVPYHYHDQVEGVEAAHSFGFQAEFLKLLALSGRFVLCVPPHDSPECHTVDNDAKRTQTS